MTPFLTSNTFELQMPQKSTASMFLPTRSVFDKNVKEKNAKNSVKETGDHYKGLASSGGINFMELGMA